MKLPTSEWKKLLKKVPMIAADGVVIKDGRILLVKRTTPPFLDYRALPGGFIDYKERLEKAVVREVFEETGLRTGVVRLVGIYDDPRRDPRGHIISVAFLLKVKGGKIRGSNETEDVRFFPLRRLPKRIGLSHRETIKDALKILMKKKK